jgi:hypothetical protein
MQPAVKESPPVPPPGTARHRPAGITMLATLAGLVALRDLWDTLQYLGLLPATLGPLAFYDRDFLAALLWGFTAATWGWATVNLWRISAGTTSFFPILHWLAERVHHPQVLVFVTALAGWNLALTVLSILGGTAFLALLPDLLVHGIILLYLLSPSVRRLFAGR